MKSMEPPNDDGRALRCEAHDGPRGHALAAARFSDEPDGLARRDIKRDTFHGVYRFLARGDARGEVRTFRIGIDPLNASSPRRELRAGRSPRR